MEICSAYFAYQILKSKLTAEVEEFWAIALSSCLKVQDCQLIFRGTVDSCQVHPRDIFRFGFKANASRLILAHNHPSGECSPSREDVSITDRLIDVGYIMELPIIDHLILTQTGFHSMAEYRDCDFSFSAKRKKRLGVAEPQLNYQKTYLTELVCD